MYWCCYSKKSRDTTVNSSLITVWQSCSRRALFCCSTPGDAAYLNKVPHNFFLFFSQRETFFLVLITGENKLCLFWGIFFCDASFFVAPPVSETNSSGYEDPFSLENGRGLCWVYILSDSAHFSPCYVEVNSYWLMQRVQGLFEYAENCKSDKECY